MAKTDHPPIRLMEVLRYDPDTGHLHWMITTHGRGGMINPGDIAGSSKNGYLCINLDGCFYRAHRLAWFMMTGDWLPASQDIDHANGIRSDNRWSNLRLATRSQNNMNGKIPVNNKSGYRGVSWRKDTQKWHARIYVNRKPRLLGDYDTLKEAAAARAAAERELCGAYSSLGRR